MGELFIHLKIISLSLNVFFLCLPSLFAQNIIFTPETDTLLVQDGCTGAVIICILSSSNAQDSIIISPGFNTSLLYHNNSGQWQYTDQCYFLLQDSSDQYDYELWYLPQGVLPYFQQVTFDSSFETWDEHFLLTLVVKSQGIPVDSLSQQCRAEFGLAIPNDPDPLPATVQLFPNYPNPFNATTTIAYYLPAGAEVNLSIYNIAGQLMTNLIREKKVTGDHFIKWDASQYNSGVYFIHLESGNFRSVQKCILVK